MGTESQYSSCQIRHLWPRFEQEARRGGQEFLLSASSQHLAPPPPPPWTRCAPVRALEDLASRRRLGVRRGGPPLQP